MDFKNLLSALSGLSNMQGQNQKQNFSQTETQPQSVSYYPADFSSPAPAQNYGKNLNQENSFWQSQSNWQNTNVQAQNFQQNNQSLPNGQNSFADNISNLLPLLGMLFGGNKINLSQLLSSSAFSEKLGNLKPFLNLFGQKQNKEDKNLPIDSYKKIGENE